MSRVVEERTFIQPTHPLPVMPVLIEERAAHLLKQVAPPAPLSAAALLRIEAHLQAATAPRPSGLRWALLAPALAGFCGVLVGALVIHGHGPAKVLLASHHPPRMVEASAGCPGGTCEPIREVRVPSGGSAQLAMPGMSGARVALLGPGAATLPPSPGEPLLLSSGRLLVSAGAEALVVAVPGGRVTVHPGAAAEIEVHEHRGVRVAAYVGSSAISLSGGPEAVVSAGSSWTAAGVATIEPAQRLLGLGLLGLPGEVPPARVPPSDKVGAPERRDRTPRHAREPGEAPVTGKGVAQIAARSPEDEDASAASSGRRGEEAETALQQESRLLSQALQHLRREHDGDGTLKVLDEYVARFPRGALRPEAAAARVDAWMLLGRHEQALSQLDGMDLFGQPRAAEFLVLRGELQARAGQRAGAVADFTRALDAFAADRPDLEERALYGRAQCRARLGDETGARSDLRRYLARFPGGRFSDEAREVLGK